MLASELWPLSFASFSKDIHSEISKASLHRIALSYESEAYNSGLAIKCENDKMCNAPHAINYITCVFPVERGYGSIGLSMTRLLQYGSTRRHRPNFAFAGMCRIIRCSRAMNEDPLRRANDHCTRHNCW